MRLLILLGLAALLLGCASQEPSAPTGADGNGAAAQPEGGAPSTNQAGNASTEAGGAGGTVTAAELAAHSSPEDCWVLYDGEVYGVTSYLPQHPDGGASIEPSCGKTDSSFADAFEGKHGTEKVEALKEMGELKGAFAE